MGWVVNATFRPFYPQERTRYPFYRRLGGSRGRSGRVRKISHPPGFDPWTVQPVPSRYTDWAIPAHINFIYGVLIVSEKYRSFVTSCRAVYCSPSNPTTHMGGRRKLGNDKRYLRNNKGSVSFARGGAVGWVTAVPGGSLRIPFPMMSLEFFIDIIILVALSLRSWLSL
jgi:hypothetical protein